MNSQQILYPYNNSVISQPIYQTEIYQNNENNIGPIEEYQTNYENNNQIEYYNSNNQIYDQYNENIILFTLKMSQAKKII